jgi:cytoplasmic iron level regulating protein YaaA (DUF328/UPF0246 family)
MVLLLSPAKTLDLSSTAIKLASQPLFQKEAQDLTAELAKLSKPQLKTLLGVSDSINTLNYNRYQNFDEQESKQAILSFDGPAFKGLAVHDMNDKQMQFAQEHLRVLCGLYGVLRPFDCIKPYRLDMSKKLVNAEGSNLYAFWGDKISEYLNECLGTKAKGSSLVVNCASQEYFKSIRPKVLQEGVKIVTCVFPGPSVYAKRARGMMCRFVIENEVLEEEGLEGFQGYGDDKYTYSAAQSSDGEKVFLRSGGGGAKKKAPTKRAKTAPKGKDNEAGGGEATKPKRRKK